MMRDVEGWTRDEGWRFQQCKRVHGDATGPTRQQSTCDHAWKCTCLLAVTHLFDGLVEHEIHKLVIATQRAIHRPVAIELDGEPLVHVPAMGSHRSVGVAAHAELTEAAAHFFRSGPAEDGIESLLKLRLLDCRPGDANDSPA